MKPLREYKDQEVVLMYRNRFSGIEGNLVLEHILDLMGVFDDEVAGQTVERATLKACGMRILHFCGINNESNQLDMVQALFKAVPIETFEKENEEDD